MLRYVVAFTGGLLLSGCVSTKTVKADIPALQRGEHASVTVTKRPMPAFTALTAGKAMFGVLGAAAMISAGNEIVSSNGIEDPAVFIGQELGRTLGERLSLPVQAADGVLAATKPAEMARQYPEGGLLLDVQTVNWSFGYFPSDWNNYRVMYSVKMRLVDAASGKAVAEGFCARVPEDKTGAPTHDQLLADNAAELKARLQHAAGECAEELKVQVLGVT